MRGRGGAVFLALTLALTAVPAAAQQANTGTIGDTDTGTNSVPGSTAGADEIPLLDLGQPAVAPVTTLEVPSPIVTVEIDRLFAESAWGERVQAEVDRRGQVLASENRQIEDELVAEEQALTRLRPEMEPVAFRERAAEFDAKVQRIRSEQDAKLTELNSFGDSERQRFFQAVPEALRRVLKEAGAVAIVDQRVVLLSVAAIDITDKAIVQVDADLGDGTTP